MIKYLLVDQVIAFHNTLIEKFGGLSGIRDKNLLYSALSAPKASFGGKDMYPSIPEKAAVYLYHIAKNHPFNDANKRTAYVTAIAFLRVNHSSIKFEINHLETIVIGVANGKIEKEELILFFKIGKLPKII